MGSADVVPGVSGGTIALIVGIYEQLVKTVRTGAAALGHLLRLDIAAALAALRRIDWWFIGPLAIGLITAVLTLARLIELVLEDYPIGTSAFFFGLVLGSIPIAWSYVRRPGRIHVLIAAVSGVVTYVLLGLRGEALVDPSLALVFGSGAIAICAMILPGISGSLILLMLGMYDRVIEALNDRELAVIAVFAAGAVVGLALFSTLLDFLLRRYHDLVMAALVGLMLGSLRVLWPWPHGADSAAIGAPDGAWIGAVSLAVAAAAIILALGRLGRRAATLGV
ncbi:MAG: DUF368 domain-containing protein [Thermoleophilia bacterium]|nr:DUF368 domain-containing protein [Thermoleophilia bacterium]MDH3725865.1 DUF368 domain-containing protein [Thermoleophilia bacterium]